MTILIDFNGEEPEEKPEEKPEEVPRNEARSMLQLSLLFYHGQKGQKCHVKSVEFKVEGHFFPQKVGEGHL